MYFSSVILKYIDMYSYMFRIDKLEFSFCKPRLWDTNHIRKIALEIIARLDLIVYEQILYIKILHISYKYNTYQKIPYKYMLDTYIKQLLYIYRETIDIVEKGMEEIKSSMRLTS